MFPVAAYCGPEAGQPKGQNVAVSEAMDGEANEAEGIPLSAAWVLHDKYPPVTESLLFPVTIQS